MERVADSEQLWRLTLQHSPGRHVAGQPDGRLLAVNDALCRMLGYEAEELRALTFQQITHPEDFASTSSCSRRPWRVTGRRTGS